MSLRIALAGKGGVGKSTIASLVCRSLIARKVRPVLAVDADPNSCLADKLGIQVERTIGAVRESMREAPDQKPEGLSKNEWIERLINDALVESTGLDMLVMGRQEGPNCYCFVNNLLREYLAKIGRQYAAVVVDNEAGLEHLSRGAHRRPHHGTGAKPEAGRGRVLPGAEPVRRTGRPRARGAVSEDGAGESGYDSNRPRRDRL
jgi:CO dehydrogenase maturation factor